MQSRARGDRQNLPFHDRETDGGQAPGGGTGAEKCQRKVSDSFVLATSTSKPTALCLRELEDGSSMAGQTILSSENIFDCFSRSGKEEYTRACARTHVFDCACYQKQSPAKLSASQRRMVGRWRLILWHLIVITSTGLLD